MEQNAVTRTLSSLSKTEHAQFKNIQFICLIPTETLEPEGPSQSNIAEAIDYIDRWPVQIIANGFLSDDSFFILSGFLIGYIFFQQAQKTDGKFPWLYFYIHRYIRLIPVYMIVLAFYATVSPFLGSGPLWPDYEVIQGCKENWWWNMLFINNFQSITSKKCMEWSWYLANDMQFYVISPLFLITLW
ncbi:Nose resistant to fluoxetine protein 6, partial [Araneus ventricosus]